MDTYTDSELDTLLLLQTGMEVSHRIHDTQTSPYCSLRIVFMRLGIAEVHQEPIPEQLSNMPIVALDNLGTRSLICPHHLPVLFGIKLAGEFGGVHEITEHHGELAAFGVRGGPFGWL